MSAALDAMFERVDAELADNDAFRAEIDEWPTIRTLVDCGKVPPAALEWLSRDNA